MMYKFLVSLILGALPLTMMAQDDDMYFVPSKKSVGSTTVRNVRPAPTFYSGSNRSVDEYNRRGGSYYQVLPTDSVGNDIISFNGELGVYPDSTAVEDFELTRQMSRWDGYEPDAAYAEGYRDGTRVTMLYGWHSPWFYSSYYPWYDSYWYWHDPWYYGWYDPWYYSWDPWYYGYGYGLGYHSYLYGYYPPHYVGLATNYHNGPAGTERHGRISYSGPRGSSNGRSTTYSAGTFGGRSIGSATTGRNGSFGGSRSTSTSTRSASTGATRRVTSNANGNFGGSRTTTTTSSNTRSTYTPPAPSISSSSSSSSSSGSFGGGGSFGGSRSSGGGGGGSRSGGGGFGGRR